MEQALTDMIRQCTAAMESMNSMMSGMDGMLTGAPGAMSASGGPLVAGDDWSFVLAALVGAVLAVGLTLAIGRVGGRRAAALSISADARGDLDLRYARGEIERDTYLRQRADLAAAAAR